MSTQRNLLTALGCSSSIALALSVAPPALASPTDIQLDSDRIFTTFTQADDNPILDALTCSCARCMMGQLVEQ